MNFARAATGRLQEFLVGATIEIRESGSRIRASPRFPGKCEGKEITVPASPQDCEVVRRFRGLPFSRWNDGQVYFDAGGTWEELRKENELELKQLVLNRENFRHPLG
jgi:hypothetical protein